MNQEININFINNTLRLICERLNDYKINYYVVGAIGAYIDAKNHSKEFTKILTL